MNVVMNWWKLQAEQAPVAWKGARDGTWSSNCLSFPCFSFSDLFVFWLLLVMMVGQEKKLEQPVLLQEQSTAMTSAPPLMNSRLLDFRNTEHSKTLLLPPLGGLLSDQLSLECADCMHELQKMPGTSRLGRRKTKKAPVVQSLLLPLFNFLSASFNVFILNHCEKSFLLSIMIPVSCQEPK